MTTTYTLQSALGMSLLHSLWQAALLALLACAALSLLARRSAAMRHVVGMGFLLAMAIAPVATFIRLTGQSAVSAAPTVATGGWAALPVVSGPVAFATSLPAPSWLPWLWCAGVMVMLVRLIGGWWVVRALDQQAFEPLPAAWLQRADTLRRALGIRRQVAIRLLHGVGLPCSARAWRPVIWLPVSMLTRLDPDQIEALIAHELGHIRRLDWIWNGLQCAVEALLFYHPGMWWLSRRIRAERENACDDLAVAVCGDAIVLAEALATLERHRMPAHALVLSATGGALMQRITRLLSSDQSAHPSARLRWAAPVGVMAVVCSGALLAAQLQSGVAQTSPVAPIMPVGAVSSSAAPHAPRPARTVRVDNRGESFHLAESRAIGGDRSYRRNVNGAGKVVEAYTVGGKPMPIDAGVRQWIARMQTAAENHVPPAPPAPPAPPSFAALPMPPAPPLPPSLTRSAPYQAAVRSLQHEDAVIAKVGSPVVGGEVLQYSHLSENHADLIFTVSGPKGIAKVRTTAQLQAGQWQVKTIDLEGN